MFDLTTLSDAELLETYERVDEYYGEIDTQFRSEVALYGDAWHGGAIDLQNAQKDYNRYRKACIERGLITPRPTDVTNNILDDVSVADLEWKYPADPYGDIDF